MRTAILPRESMRISILHLPPRGGRQEDSPLALLKRRRKKLSFGPRYRFSPPSIISWLDGNLHAAAEPRYIAHNTGGT